MTSPTSSSSVFKFSIVRPLLIALCAGAVSLACGGDDDGNGSGSDSGQDGGSDAGSDGSDGSTSGTGGSASDGSTSTGGTSSDPANTACGLASTTPGTTGVSEGEQISDFEACAVESREAEVIAADIFIMLDQSISMGEHRIVESDPDSPTRWEALTDALKGFIGSDEAAGLRVGMQYFGLPVTGGTVSCDSEDYAVADVEIGELPGNAEALIGSINAHGPSNLTPSVPALEGALMHAKQWAIENPGRPTAVVFATDGYPTECERKSISDLVEIAESYANPTDDSPRISTFVVGVGQVPNLKVVAEAGGSTQAYFVGDCPTAVEDLTAALQRVANSPALCGFDLPEAPEGESLDPSKVNMVFTPHSTGDSEIVDRVASPADCGAGGWYYDNINDPTFVNVCPETCGGFGGGVVDLVVGCETRSVE